MPEPDIVARPVARATELEELRWEIDRIDNALLALMDRRIATAHAVAAAKQSAPSRWLNLRPDREAGVIDRLSTRAEAMPEASVRAIWRELIGLNLQAQRRMEVVLHAGARPALVASAARQRFGGGAPVVVADCAAEALDRARGRDAVAVIELSPLSGWWVALAEDPDLVIFEGLRDSGGALVALAVGRIAPDCLPARERYAIIGEGSLRQRAVAGEPIRAIAMSGHLRLCVTRTEAAR